MADVTVDEDLLLLLIQATKDTANQLADAKGWPRNDMKAWQLADKVSESMRR